MSYTDFDRMIRRNYIFKNNMNINENWEDKEKKQIR